MSRGYATRRRQIVDGLVVVLKAIDKSGQFNTDIGDEVHPTLKFWDEVDVFPTIHISAGSESREYLGGGVKIRYLSVTVRVYVQGDQPDLLLDELLEDIETVLEDNSQLSYTTKLGVTAKAQQITVVSIDTDEGVLEPLGIGEMLLEVRY